MIKYDWGEYLAKIAKWLTPIIKHKKVTYSNSSLKLWKGRKYAISLLSVKKYKKNLIFFVTKTLNNIANYLLELTKMCSQQPTSQFTVFFIRTIS